MMLHLLPEVMRGTRGRFRSLELQSDRPLYIHTDGEIFAGLGMDVRKLKIKIVPGAIEIVA